MTADAFTLEEPIPHLIHHFSDAEDGEPLLIHFDGAITGRLEARASLGPDVVAALIV